jgi:DNA (cytosine-5)-methyltransferase 1
MSGATTGDGASSPTMISNASSERYLAMAQKKANSHTRRAEGRQSAPRFLAVDFFCGAGGTTRGLIDARGYVIAGIDKDARCRETFVDNNYNAFIDYSAPRFLHMDVFPKSPDYPSGKQRELFAALDDLIPYYQCKARDIPMLFAICAPCQPFTRLSRNELSQKRKAIRKRDRNLLREACKFVKKFQPDLVLAENVAGIDDPKYGGVWEDFRKHLDRLGYVTGSKIVCASRFGIPQYRKRSILIAAQNEAVRRERFADLFQTELLVPESDPNANLISVAEAIGHLPPLGPGETHPKIRNHSTRGMSDLNRKRLSEAKPGMSNAYMETTKFGDLSLKCHRTVNGRLGTRCFSDVYTRMRPDHPSPTITTRCHSISNGRFGHYDPKQVRGISIREAAILQSFPADYVFYPEDQVEPLARMIGNAVPPKLAEFFAGYLVNTIVVSHRLV